jgi:hypothetical protein
MVRLSSKTGHVDVTIAVQRNMSLHLAYACNSVILEPKSVELRAARLSKYSVATDDLCSGGTFSMVRTPGQSNNERPDGAAKCVLQESSRGDVCESGAWLAKVVSGEQASQSHPRILRLPSRS